LPPLPWLQAQDGGRLVWCSVRNITIPLVPASPASAAQGATAGTIVGAVVGSVAAVALIGLGAWAVSRWAAARQLLDRGSGPSAVSAGCVAGAGPHLHWPGTRGWRSLALAWHLACMRCMAVR